MAYTNTWTTAAPLDTQAANQGAVDFRATKLDVMQRIASFGAGLLAARPTPEVTSASADWTGVMYWAIDTKQVFKWNGSSWDDISTDLPGGGSSATLFAQGGFVTAPANIGNNTIYSFVIPANTLNVSNGGFFGIFNLNTTITGGNSIAVTLSVVNAHGTQNTTIINDSTTGDSYQSTFRVVKGSVVDNYSALVNSVTNGTLISITDISNFDNTINQTISIKAQKTLAGDTANFFNAVFSRI